MKVLKSADRHYRELNLRDPNKVMRLDRMGSFFPTRLSFMRIFLRKILKAGVNVSRPLWRIDKCGYGLATYAIKLDGYTYSLVAFSTLIDAKERTDRVIAEVWDASFVLFDGVPGEQDLERLKVNVPKQEKGRFLDSELILSRANKSLRLFDHVVESLAKGSQPNSDLVNSIGYLMRTTAVYGNGKFGIADREKISGRPFLSGSFQAEMLTVWLIRGFTHDLVEHIAKMRAPKSSILIAPNLKKHLGVGNATGLGMAPFLVNHPVLIHQWALAREIALARVKVVPEANKHEIHRALELIERVHKHLREWNVSDQFQMLRIMKLRKEFFEFKKMVTKDWLASPYPWKRIVNVPMAKSFEFQELIIALVLELNGKIVDGLADCMEENCNFNLNPNMTVEELIRLIEVHYAWVFEIDFNDPRESALFWYTSEEKLEPRLGQRQFEPGVEKELPLDIARQVQLLVKKIKSVPLNNILAEFLLSNPDFRFIIERIQRCHYFPYSEIRNNLICSDCLPINMLRWKLSFFGASKFDPKSDRWIRITLYQGAPTISDISSGIGEDDWWLPTLETAV